MNLYSTDSSLPNQVHFDNPEVAQAVTSRKLLRVYTDSKNCESVVFPLFVNEKDNKQAHQLYDKYII
jgi:hypothetical protein